MRLETSAVSALSGFFDSLAGPPEKPEVYLRRSARPSFSLNRKVPDLHVQFAFVYSTTAYSPGSSFSLGQIL